MRRLSLLFLLLVAANAQAHRLQLFAAVEQHEIRGYAWFPGGGRAAGVQLTIHAAGEVTSLTTDADGAFVYPAIHRVDHLLVVTTSDGHRAQWIVHAAELPSSLPGGDLTALPHDAVEHAGDTDLVPLVEAAVARQLRPLREELHRMEHRARWRDLLGGIGYIFGIMGLLLYYKTRHLRKLAPHDDP